MIISLKNKFICFNPPKTGTAYREKIFKDYCDFSILKNLEIKFRHSSVRNLLTNTVKELENINIDEYFKFTFIRNPWERYASWFNMECVQKKINNKDRKKYFFSFIKERSQLNIQKNYCIYKNGLIDYIGEATTQSDEIYLLGSKLGINFNRSELEVKYGDEHGSKITRFSHPYDWREFYERDTINMVQESEKYVIALKGYSFY